MRLHALHPEMVGVDADGVNGLLEGKLDFEPQAVEPDDVGRIEAEVGGQEDALAPCRMIDEDESDNYPHGSPEQVEGAEVEGDILLSIDGARGGLHGRRVGKQRAQGDLVTILLRPATIARAECWGGGRVIGNGIALCPSDQMIALSQ
jgi:hypothetical protein